MLFKSTSTSYSAPAIAKETIDGNKFYAVRRFAVMTKTMKLLIRIFLMQVTMTKLTIICEEVALIQKIVIAVFLFLKLDFPFKFPQFLRNTLINSSINFASDIKLI